MFAIMHRMQNLIELEEQMNSFDAGERRQALLAVIPDHLPPSPPTHTNLNMHYHSFFSYNAEGYSPTRIAWEARKAGLYAAGLCDFDVLDGLDEFLDAGLVFCLRTTVNLETRVYVRELADVDISSPGEAGVGYMMGAGFVRRPAPGSQQAAGLAGYRDRARARNVALIQRINAKLAAIAIDYEEDVVPLTPAGAATERHIISAYINKSHTVFADPEKSAQFWSGVLGRPFEETVALMGDTPEMEEAVRSKLVKRGGLGYEQPSPQTFPPVEEFIRWVASCGAIPMLAWLDGTSGGEKDPRKFLEQVTGKGIVAVNIIPDRNWNISNADARRIKTANLRQFVEEADRLGLPINIGTEMNKLGLPFVDNLDCDALKPFKQSFLRGARIMTGHTWLARYAGLSYVGQKAGALFGSVAAKNDFFGKVGALPPLDKDRASALAEMGEEKALQWFTDRVKKQ